MYFLLKEKSLKMWTRAKKKRRNLNHSCQFFRNTDMKPCICSRCLCDITTWCHHSSHLLAVSLSCGRRKGAAIQLLSVHPHICTFIHLYMFFPISTGSSVSYTSPPLPGPPRVLRSCQSLTKGSRFFQINSWPDRMYQLQEGTESMMGNDLRWTWR